MFFSHFPRLVWFVFCQERSNGITQILRFFFLFFDWGVCKSYGWFLEDCIKPAIIQLTLGRLDISATPWYLLKFIWEVSAHLFVYISWHAWAELSAQVCVWLSASQVHSSTTFAKIGGTSITSADLSLGHTLLNPQWTSNITINKKPFKYNLP